MLYFAVFDGHGGPVCAQYCNQNMVKHIKYWLERGEKDLQIILENSFIEVNNSFARYITYNPLGTKSLPKLNTKTVINKIIIF